MTDDSTPQADDLPSTRFFDRPLPRSEFPESGMPARDAYELIHLGLRVDGQPSMNLASFVTTWMEPEAEALIHEAISTNHIDHEEYPIADQIEEICVRLLADLWNAPDVSRAVGVATIGSSEAIMLGLLAHKFRWRDKRKAAGLPTDQPNVVFGAETHIVWDKFARYFDVEMRKIPMRADHFVLHPDDVAERIDENTIAVGAVLGTTFIGENDPISELNDLLVSVKAERGWDIPLHVDGASGGFIAPFAKPDELWDFRLEQVASINASGHKYGLVYPGVGWLVFRDRDLLSDDLVFSVNYLGGAQPTFTFNFSRGSAMIQAQYYQFVRLGRTGYTAIVDTMLSNARYLNERLEKTGRFEVLNPGLAEPVVTFRLTDGADFDAYHLSDRLRQHGWIVPAYTLPPNAEHVTVLRVVVR
ncbi:MAG TPA: glutamate decarboxylase, partial [Microthrixaceae bacterium]|nr:glutamate decarboxylase [Microthrixaceae bacterium]